MSRHPLRSRRTFRLSAFAAALAVAGTAWAQTGTIAFGALSNFDCYNDNDEEAEGFEIELDGLTSADVPYTFGGSYNRYGSPRIEEYPGGVRVRYEATYDAASGTWSTATPIPPAFTPTGGHACFNGGSSDYATSGCEHFGVSVSGNPTATRYHWLLRDPANPGALVRAAHEVQLPNAVWTVVPPAGGAQQPVVKAVIPAPKPESFYEFGDAQWVKVFETEMDREVGLDELLSDNPVVPRDPAQTETEWMLLQHDINGGGRNELVEQRRLGAAKKAVVRRYEFYKYAGVYDPETHEAMCQVNCDTPQPAEIGRYIGSQMAAANIGAPQSLLHVGKQGKGTVGSTPAGISVPTTVQAFFDQGSSVTLAAKPRKGWQFDHWGGACKAELTATCSLVLKRVDVTTKAYFVPVP